MQIAVKRKKECSMVLKFLVCVFMKAHFFIFYFVSLCYLLKWRAHTYYVAYVLPLAMLSYIISVLMHEMGHLLFGYCMGFKLYHLGIPFFEFQKKECKWKIIKNINGNNYCYMKYIKDGYPTINFILYYLGGCIINFFVAIICLCNVDKGIAISLCRCGLGIYSLSIGLKNIIPNIHKKYNDGTVVLVLLRDHKVKNLIGIQMKIDSELMAGKKLYDFEPFMEIEGLKKESDLSLFVHMVNYYIYLDKRLYLRAEQEVNIMEENRDLYSEDLGQLVLIEKLLIYSLSQKIVAEQVFKEITMMKLQKNFDYYCAICGFMSYKGYEQNDICQIESILINYLERNEPNEYMRVKAKVLNLHYEN